MQHLNPEEAALIRQILKSEMRNSAEGPVSANISPGLGKFLNTFNIFVSFQSHSSPSPMRKEDPDSVKAGADKKLIEELSAAEVWDWVSRTCNKMFLQEQWADVTGAILFDKTVPELPRSITSDGAAAIERALIKRKAANRPLPPFLSAFGSLCTMDSRFLVIEIQSLEFIQNHPIDILKRPLMAPIIPLSWRLLYAIVARGMAIPIITTTGDIDAPAAVVFEWVGVDLQISRAQMVSESWNGKELLAEQLADPTLEEQFEHFLFSAQRRDVFPLRRRLPAQHNAPPNSRIAVMETRTQK